MHRGSRGSKNYRDWYDERGQRGGNKMGLPHEKTGKGKNLRGGRYPGGVERKN